MGGDGRLVSEVSLVPLSLAFIGSYLLGSIPFGLVLTRLAGYGDIRKIGSGNIGATNVLRTGNKGLALMVLLLDSGKGAVAVLLAWPAGERAALAAALGAVVGHLFPLWLRFKGGKGVATTLGTLLALAPPVGAIACTTWLAVALLFRISSLAALAAMVASVAGSLALRSPLLALVVLIIAGLVWAKHAANLRRLLAGTEPRMSFSRKERA